MTELTWASFPPCSSMGSSRFLKCVRARHRHGALVAKVFVKSDPSLSLKPFHRRIKGAPLPLLSHESSLTSTYGPPADSRARRPRRLPQCPALRTRPRDGTRRLPHAPVGRQQPLRPHQASAPTPCPRCSRPPAHSPSPTCVDRSTRPFLSSVEKRWIAFQLLTGLKYARERGVRPGNRTGRAKSRRTAPDLADPLLVRPRRSHTATSRQRTSSSRPGTGPTSPTSRRRSSRPSSPSTTPRPSPSTSTRPRAARATSPRSASTPPGPTRRAGRTRSSLASATGA